MKNITKKFVETFIMDTEGRSGEYYVTSKTYEEAKKMIDCYCPRVREIEKTFHPDTFTITTKVLKETVREYDWMTGTSEMVEKMYE